MATYENPNPHYRYVSILQKDSNNNVIERFHESFRQCDKVMRGFKRNQKQYAENFKTYYNFMRIHQGLGTTPARKAGIEVKPELERIIKEKPNGYYMSKKEKMTLIFDTDEGKYCQHWAILIKDKSQFGLFRKFLANFVSDKKALNKIVSYLKYSLKFSHNKKVDTWNSHRIKDKIATIDLLELPEQKEIRVFMVVNFSKKYMKKAKSWKGDYFE